MTIPAELEAQRNETVAEIVGSVESEEMKYMWDLFLNHIARIPRTSGQEQELAEKIEARAGSDHFVPERDNANNVFVRIPATPGYESLPGVIWQTHLDMVCLHDKDVPIVPERDGVVPIIDETHKWIRAIGTTLGADNGVGVALAETIAHTEKSHGPMALLFTTSEETGLDGAMALNFDLSGYHFLINLDSEEENEATISSAGGGNTITRMPITRETLKPNMTIVELDVNNLAGGHSGNAIAEKRENANRVIALLLRGLSSYSVPFNLISIDGGEKRNSIATGARSVIAISNENMARVQQFIHQASDEFKELFPHEPTLTLSMQEPEASKNPMMFSTESTKETLDLIWEMPHGVEAMSNVISGLVETSTNEAIIRTSAEGVEITHMTRSAINESREALRKKIEAVGQKHNANVEQQEPYPGWAPEPDSDILRLLKKAYDRLGVELQLRATHGGLECGLFHDKYPHLQYVSIGPTILDAHKTTERVEIQSVENLYRVLEIILEEIAKDADK